MTAHQPDSAAVPANRILWTGGWDSTFRLCMLLIVMRHRVQPLYLIDHRRLSIGEEIAAMHRIKHAIFSMHPECRALLEPTVYLEADHLPESSIRSDQFQAIRSAGYLGDQYELLARFCDYLDVTDVELCVHGQDRFNVFLGGHTVEHLVHGELQRKMDPELPAGGHRLFERFSFPLLGVSKVRMRELAASQGFDRVLAETWFCHRPLNGEPCGLCNPCTYTIEEGVGWRIPLKNRIRGSVIRNARRLRKGISDPRLAMRKMRAFFGTPTQET